MLSTRPPAVAGLFYPDDKNQLQSMLQALLDNDHASPLNGEQVKKIKAIIVPHAGYIYSGGVAASAYRLLEARGHTIKRVVILGPSHRVPLRGMALPSVTNFTTPLGDIPLDTNSLQQLLSLNTVQTLDDAHAFEHSLEVQLPFLQMLLKDFVLIPIVVGQCDVNAVKAALKIVWGKEETLIIISSDLSHFHHYHSACQIDRNTSDLIVNKDWHLQGEQACGCYPLNGLLKLAQEISLSVCPLDLRNSGDTAGDKDRVVGYGAYALY